MMKDQDTQYLFESYLTSLEEGRKKKYEDRQRKEVVDPNTGEKRKESYYEMMQRLKGKGAGPRSRATRTKKEKTSNKVKLANRKFKVADKSYEERLKPSQLSVVRFVEVKDETEAKEIVAFLQKTGFNKEEAISLLNGMIMDGYLDETFEGAKEGETVETNTNDAVAPTALMDTEYDEYQDDELEDY